MRIGKRWAGCLAAGLFLLCAAGLLWLLGAETVPRQEPARLTPEAVSGAPGLDGLYLYAGPLSLEYTLPEQAEGLHPVPPGVVGAVAHRPLAAVLADVVGPQLPGELTKNA